MGQLGDILVGGVDNENSAEYPDEMVLTWKQDTSGNYYLCESSDYIIRPIRPLSPDMPTLKVQGGGSFKDVPFYDLDEAKAYVENRVRAGL